MCSAFWAGMYFKMIDVNKYEFNGFTIKKGEAIKRIEDMAIFVLAIRGFMTTFATQNTYKDIYLTLGDSDFKITFENSKVKDITHIRGEQDYTGDMMAIAYANNLLD
jgi:hypothetical protein